MVAGKAYTSMEGDSSGGTKAARHVMVVVDPTRESTGALQYALSHGIVENDTLILFHIETPNAWKINPLGASINHLNGLFRKPVGNGGGAPSNYHVGASAVVGEGGGGPVEFLDAMKEAYMAAQPKVKAEMAEGKDKASLILGMSTAYKVDLLIIGHKRSFANSVLGGKRAGPFRDTVECLIFNSKCTCVAVQKKGNCGYLLTSKKHKNFWVLGIGISFPQSDIIYYHARLS